MKRCTIVLELLTVLCTDAANSTGRVLRVSEKIRRHLVSADFNGGSRFVSYLKFCRYHVRDAQRRDLEIPRWLVLL